MASIRRLPYEVLLCVSASRLLTPRDLFSASLSGKPLAAAAQEVLNRVLNRAIADPNVVGGADATDPLACTVLLSNAISRDDPLAVAALLRAGRATPNDLLPTVGYMARWVSPVVAVFGVTRDNVVYGAPKARHAMGHNSHAYPCRIPGPEGFVSYELSDDVAVAYCSALQTTWRTLPSTPLVRAICCGAHRVVRVLLAAGARCDPSPEALVVCAIDHLFSRTVALVKHHVMDLNCLSDHPWGPRRDRSVDGSLILADLVAAFPRSLVIDRADVNPLSQLRTVFCSFAPIEYHADECTQLAKGPLHRLQVSLAALLRAGYSPDERVAAAPRERRIYGLPYRNTEQQIQGPRTCNNSHIIMPIPLVDDHRRSLLDITEHQAAFDARLIEVPDVVDDKRPLLVVVALGTAAILDAYEAGGIVQHKPE